MTIERGGKGSNMKQNQGKKKTLKPFLKRLALLAVFIAVYLIADYLFPGVPGAQSDPVQPGEPAGQELSLLPQEEKDESGTTGENDSANPGQDEAQAPAIDKDGAYTSKEDVALYIHTYGKLPGNFIKKAAAEGLGWSGGKLDKYQKNACIGGDYFGNYEGILPTAKGRVYTECDIDTMGAKARGIKRIVFSNDGLIYYTDDHYESFTLIYGEE